MTRFLFFFILLFEALSANPWGKDADLAFWSPESQPKAEKQELNLMAKFGETCIKFHQDVISPADGPRSNFFPSSSQYTLDAVRKYGFWYGCLLGFDRLMRENDDPWVYPKTLGPRGLTKYDPVR